MMRVKDLLGNKGRAVWSIGPAQSVYQAIEMMATKGIGALTVLSDDGRLVGIISERDYARKVILKNKLSKETPISEIMTTAVLSVSDETSIDECMTLMTDNKVRHLPVMAGDELIGMVSLGDVVKFIIDNQSTTIDQLERYIKGEARGVSL